MEEVQGDGVLEGGDERLHPCAEVAVEADAEQLVAVAEDDGGVGGLWRQLGEEGKEARVLFWAVKKLSNGK